MFVEVVPPAWRCSLRDPPLVFRGQLGCGWLHRFDTNVQIALTSLNLAKKKKKNATV
jgi:hypothetical protein